MSMLMTAIASDKLRVPERDIDAVTVIAAIVMTEEVTGS